MANTPETNPTPTPKTAVVNEGGTQKTASVNEGGTKNLDTLSVSEKKEYARILKVKEERGLLSVSEKEALQALNNANNKDLKKNNEGDVAQKDGDENEDPDPDKKGPFKEGDIIKYMYEDWLIGGANWLYCKCAVKLEKGYYSAQRLINERRRQKQLEKGRTDSTQDAHNLITDTAIKSGEKNEKLIDNSREKQLENIKLMREGKFDEAKVSPLTKVLMENMDDKERKEYLKVAEHQVNNFYDNMAMAERFAANYARAGMTCDIAKDPDYYKNNPDYKDANGNDLNLNQIYELQKKRAMVLFGRTLDREAEKGNDPQKLAAKMFEASEKAVKAGDKTIDKGSYKEKGHDIRVDLAENLVFISDRLKEENTSGPRGLYESAIVNQNADKAAQDMLSENSQAMGALLYKRDENNGRRDRLADLKQKLGITDENIDALAQIAQTQQANSDRAKRIKDGQNMNAGGAAVLGLHMNGGR